MRGEQEGSKRGRERTQREGRILLGRALGAWRDEDGLHRAGVRRYPCDGKGERQGDLSPGRSRLSARIGMEGREDVEEALRPAGDRRQATPSGGPTESVTESVLSTILQPACSL